MCACVFVCMCFWTLFFCIDQFFFKKVLFIFRETGREGEREGEKHQRVVASHVPPTRYLAQNPGMCPDWESNQRPFSMQAGAGTTEPHQPGLIDIFIFMPIQGCNFIAV